ncbi:MAG: 2Fe-2S iron-sulfur cluster-binding protein [Verrucomicrobiae bacterium]|nr:2Fe-2S iron-sulfur cluster-binding protein [Verrucomicrobiae bacterium]
MSATRKISITVNGQECAGEQGQTILEIARANKIYIPTLCYMKGLSPWGGCRLCIVEVEGNPKVVPSCSTPAVEGMKITTHNERLVSLRKATLELLFSERNHICPFCEYNKGDCGLQHQGMIHGITGIRFNYLYPKLPVDLTGRYFGMDHNRCILCTRCVRACDEIEGVHTLDVANRGINNRIVVDMNTTFGASETCTQCGTCVNSCPTGALFDKAAAFRGQWTSCQQVYTTCTECPVGCGLMVHTKEGRIVNVWGDPQSPVNTGHLCVKGRYQTWAEPRDRILQPLLRKNGKLPPVSWDEAIQFLRRAANVPPQQKALLALPRLTNEAAATMAAIKDRFGQIAMHVVTNEAALCSEPSFTADALQRLRESDAIIVVGAHPSRDNGVVAARIRVAVRKRGARLLIFHARKSDLDRYADVAANVVGLERKFWNRVREALEGVRRPAIVYGPNAMTQIGVTVLDRLIEIFEANAAGGEPLLVCLPVSPAALAMAAAGIPPVEDAAPWLDAKPLKYLHIVASDAPDGGATLLEERHVAGLLEQIDCVVLQAAYRSALTEKATVVLPTTVWFEKSGTVTNLEGRQLPLRPALSISGQAREDKAILESLYA